ncbi:MAG: hypothetical protein RBS99_19615 [Rhodospirillales bacterium]|jgi:phage terminase large subunit-like protein|nr:hypothetical protein [Rhodospirillales bacterium]
MSITITKAMVDPNLFEPYLRGRQRDLNSWQAWRVCLKAVYGRPITTASERKLVEECTGRSVDELDPAGYDEALLLCGRRSGKSRIAGFIAGYESTLSGREATLDPGELGLVTVVSPTKLQSRIVHRYIEASLSSPMLQREVLPGDREGFELRSGVRVQILAGNFATVRGFSQLCVVVDEICFFGVEEESKIRSDTELIRAVRPALANSGGKLIAIGSKYAEKGWGYRTWKRWREGKQNRTLVWDAPSKRMNPLLRQSVIDAALADDYEAARAEYLNEWRQDVSTWLPREAIEPCIVPNRKELIARPNVQYVGFVDLSGGRSDSGACAISHRDADKKKSVLDCVKEYRAPYSPAVAVADMCDVLKSYGIRRVIGDNYSGEWVSQAFVKNGISYQKSDKPKSAIYLELLPRICSGEVELLDDPVLIQQLCGLERRTRSGGKDIVDHSPGAKDDVANAAAGALVNASKGRFEFGFLRRDGTGTAGSGKALRNRIALGRLAQMQSGRH